MLNMEDTKRKGLILAYYLSRCNIKAVKSLGYNSFVEAFNELGKLIDENPNNIKNMRDEFDPYFDNGRRGWYQRALSPSRQEVFDEFANVSDKELEEQVKSLIGKNNPANVGSLELLKDLGALIRQSTLHYNKDFVWQDVELTDEFQDAYEEYLSKNNYKIEYFSSTSIITTPTAKNIFVPNQWFVIASYAVGVYSELHKYKHYFERVADCQREKFDTYARNLRDNASIIDRDAFINAGEKVILIEKNDEMDVHRAARRLWRFATDYSWWSGQKTIDRGDFYLSVVLNMLNLVNASQGYVGDIVNAYGSDSRLMELTSDLGAFTKNMEGETYDIAIPTELIDEDICGFDIEPEKKNGSPRIKISASSIKKLGGR